MSFAAPRANLKSRSPSRASYAPSRASRSGSVLDRLAPMKTARKTKAPSAAALQDQVEMLQVEVGELQAEMQMWNQTWTKLMALLTNVVPFPSVFPQTPLSQRSCLEELTEMVCQLAADPSSNEQYKAMEDKLSRCKTKLEDERNKNKLLSEQIVRDRQLHETRINEIQQQHQESIQRVKEERRFNSIKHDMSTQSKKAASTLLRTPSPKRSPSPKRAASPSPTSRTAKSDVGDASPRCMSYMVEVRRSNDKGDFIGASNYRQRRFSPTSSPKRAKSPRKSPSKHKASNMSITSEDLELVAEAVSQAFAERDRQRQLSPESRFYTKPKKSPKKKGKSHL